MTGDDARAIVENRLSRVIEQNGKQIVGDRSRLTALLRDAMMNEHRPLVSMLLRTLDEDVPATLLRSATDARPYRVVESDAIASVVANTLSEPDAVAWAVRAWARALGVGATGDDGGAEQTSEPEVTQRRKRETDAKPLPPWYKTRMGAIAAGIVAVAVVAIVGTHLPSPSPDSNPTPSPSAAATAAPTFLLSTPGATIAPFFRTSTSFTCPMQNATVSDDFKTHDKRWDPLSTSTAIRDKYLVLTEPKGGLGWAFEHDRIGSSTTLCAEISNSVRSASATHDASAAGIAFWSEQPPGDTHPLIYAFFISPNGRFGVWRYQHALWTALIATSVSTAINQGATTYNVVTVAMQGSDATFYINGRDVGSVHDVTPRGSFGGVIAESSLDDGMTIPWYFGYYAYQI